MQFDPTEWRSRCGRYAIRVWKGEWSLVLIDGLNFQPVPAKSFDDAVIEARAHQHRETQCDTKSP